MIYIQAPVPNTDIYADGSNGAAAVTSEYHVHQSIVDLTFSYLECWWEANLALPEPHKHMARCLLSLQLIQLQQLRELALADVSTKGVIILQCGTVQMGHSL